MKKWVVVVLVTFGLVWLVAGLWAAWIISKTIRNHGEYNVRVEVPKVVTKNTLAVFSLRPRGTNADAKLYGIGFSRALADRLACAPTVVTQQPSTQEISNALCLLNKDSQTAPSEDMVLKTGKHLGVHYAVSGDIELQNGNVKINAVLFDISGKEPKVTIALSGPVSSLPALQTQAVDKVVAVMKLQPKAEQIAELHKPNFTTSQTLKLYGESFVANDTKRIEALRWQMVKTDPKGSFPVLRLLEFYIYGPATCPEIKANSRLQALITNAGSSFPRNSNIKILKGLLLAKQFEYSDAENVLRRAAKDDTAMVRAHTALGYIGLCRENGKLAVNEFRKAADLWPENAYLHARLAQAYAKASDNARHGHYPNEMSYAVRHDWESCSNDCLQEATLAITINPNCDEGWYQLMIVDLGLSRRNERDKAFQELVRLTPKDPNIYEDYSYGALPQWSGSSGQMEGIFRQAESAIGKDSPEMCCMRADMMQASAYSQKDDNEIMRLAEMGLQKSNGQHSGCLMNKAEALFGMKRWEESLQVAQKGYKRWGTLAWEWRIARCDAIIYQERSRGDKLVEAEKLFAHYASEIPYDPNAYVQWGWCLSHLGNPQAAKAKFLKALELDPANELAKEKMKYVQ